MPFEIKFRSTRFAFRHEDTFEFPPYQILEDIRLPAFDFTSGPENAYAGVAEFACIHIVLTKIMMQRASSSHLSWLYARILWQEHGMYHHALRCARGFLGNSRNTIEKHKEASSRLTALEEELKTFDAWRKAKWSASADALFCGNEWVCMNAIEVVLSVALIGRPAKALRSILDDLRSQVQRLQPGKKTSTSALPATINVDFTAQTTAATYTKYKGCWPLTSFAQSVQRQRISSHVQTMSKRALDDILESISIKRTIPEQKALARAKARIDRCWRHIHRWAAIDVPNLQLQPKCWRCTILFGYDPWEETQESRTRLGNNFTAIEGWDRERLHWCCAELASFSEMVRDK